METAVEFLGSIDWGYYVCIFAISAAAGYILYVRSRPKLAWTAKKESRSSNAVQSSNKKSKERRIKSAQSREPQQEYELPYKSVAEKRTGKANKSDDDMNHSDGGSSSNNSREDDDVKQWAIESEENFDSNTEWQTVNKTRKGSYVRLSERLPITKIIL